MDSQQPKKKSKTSSRSSQSVQKDFQDLQNDIGTRLNQTQITGMATSYGFTNAEKGEIKGSDSPGSVFVQKLVDKGLISSTKIKKFLTELRKNDMKGIADEIKKKYPHFADQSRYSLPTKAGTSKVSTQRGAQRKGDVKSETMEETGGTKRKKSMSTGSSSKTAKIPARNFSNVKAGEAESHIYIHELFQSPATLQMAEDKAYILGVAFEISSNTTEEKDVYVSKSSGAFHSQHETVYTCVDGRDIEKGHFYSLSNFYCVSFANNEGILIPPAAKALFVSRRKFKGIDIGKLKGKKRKVTQANIGINLPVHDVKAAMNGLPKWQTVFSIKGVIKEIELRPPPPSWPTRRVITLIDNEQSPPLSVVFLSEHIPITPRDGLIENISVQLQNFITMGSGETNYLLSTTKSNFEVIEDPELEDLKKFDPSVCGYVTKVDGPHTYPACPKKECFHTKVDTETLTCRRCENKYLESDLTTYYYYNLEIEVADTDDNEGSNENDDDNDENEDDNTVRGVIFQDDLTKALQKHNPEVKLHQIEKDVNFLPNLLTDKKVKVIIKSQGQKEDKVFKKLKILKE